MSNVGDGTIDMGQVMKNSSSRKKSNKGSSINFLEFASIITTSGCTLTDIHNTSEHFNFNINRFSFTDNNAFIYIYFDIHFDIKPIQVALFTHILFSRRFCLQKPCLYTIK